MKFADYMVVSILLLKVYISLCGRELFQDVSLISLVKYFCLENISLRRLIWNI